MVMLTVLLPLRVRDDEAGAVEYKKGKYIIPSPQDHTENKLPG
jgi:hypothetical protein